MYITMVVFLRKKKKMQKILPVHNVVLDQMMVDTPVKGSLA